MTLVILAVLGWLLFVLTAILYWIGNRLNSAESNSLAVFSLAVLLSDDFRTAVRSGFNAAVEQARARGSNLQSVTYGLIEAVTENAKRCYKPDSEPNTISIVTRALSGEIKEN